jgi:glycosyltransferase involved in cell wall biosynthesis
MNKVLFIGSFLSKHQGTLGVSEIIGLELKEKGFEVNISSSKKNKIFRILDILYCTILLNYDVLHIDVFSGPSFRIAELSSRIGFWRGKRVLLTLHGGMLPEFYNKNEARVDKLFRRGSLICSPSNFLIKFFENKNYQIKYIPNSILLEHFPFQTKLINNRSLLWVRAFSDIYCPEVVIESFLIVFKLFPDAKLTMVGPDKGKLNEIKTLINTYGLEKNVTITGPIKNKELYKFYQSHAVFLNTTRYESFGVCVAEAASSGIPIVSNSVGEIPYIWKNGLNACLVDDNNPIVFAEYICEIFENENFAKKLKFNAYDCVLKFDRKLVINLWIEMLK